MSGTKVLNREGEEMPKRGGSDYSQKMGKEKSNGERAKEEKAMRTRAQRAKKRKKEKKRTRGPGGRESY